MVRPLLSDLPYRWRDDEIENADRYQDHTDAAPDAGFVPGFDAEYDRDERQALFPEADADPWERRVVEPQLPGGWER